MFGGLRNISTAETASMIIGPFEPICGANSMPRKAEQTSQASGRITLLRPMTSSSSDGAPWPATPGAYG